MKHFSCAWITGSSNQKISNIVDHANSDQAMAQFKADQAQSQNKPLTSYSTIAQCLSSKLRLSCMITINCQLVN